MKILRDAIAPEESLPQAIVRIAWAAGVGGYDGYEVVCAACGIGLDRHDGDTDCPQRRRTALDLFGGSLGPERSP